MKFIGYPVDLRRGNRYNDSAVETNPKPTERGPMQTALLEKIRKILARTEEAGCTQSEAETAFALASKLMQDHNISESEIRSVPVWAQGDTFIGTSIPIEVHHIVNMVKRFYFVDSYSFHSRSRHAEVVRFFGKPENVQTAIWIFESFTNACNRFWLEYRIENKSDYFHRRSIEGQRRNFVFGFVDGFATKLQAEQDRAGTSTALALRDVAAETTRAMFEHIPGLDMNPDGLVPLVYDDAMQAGFEAGSKLNLNREIE